MKIKPSVFLNVVLAAALVVVSARMVKSESDSSATAVSDSSEVVYQNIMTRTSVRSYQNRPVEKDKVEKLLRAGMAAPTALNRQPWHFVVVDSRELLGKIAAVTPNAGMAKDAPLAIVVCGDSRKFAEGGARDFWTQDVSAAAENILLQAHGMGLGAVWTGTYPDSERCKAVAQLLGLPKHIIPFCTIVVGYPKGDTTPKDKWNEDNVSYNGFGKSLHNAAENSSQANDFKEFDVASSFRDNPFKFFKGNGLLLAVGSRGDFNEMTIGWGALGNIWEDDMNRLAVFVAASRYTHKYMEKARYFTVMQFDDAHKNILEYMGTHSGRDGNKAKALGLHTRFTEHGTPYFDEASAVYECEMVYHAPFDPKGFGDMPCKFYADYKSGIHTMYMGKIVKAMRK